MLLPSLFNFEFFFLHSVQKAMGYKNCYRIFLNFHRKKKWRKTCTMKNCYVQKTSWELVLPRSGTSVTKSHVHDPWTRHAQTWTWGEHEQFHVIFSDTTCTRQIFCFSVFDRKYHKGIPPIYFFLLHPHYFSISESKKKKEFWNGRQEN